MFSPCIFYYRIKSNTNNCTIYTKKHFHIILYLITRHVSMSIHHHHGHFIPWSSQESYVALQTLKKLQKVMCPLLN
jgi:hypothetical protein